MEKQQKSCVHAEFMFDSATQIKSYKMNKIFSAQITNFKMYKLFEKSVTQCHNFYGE